MRKTTTLKASVMKAAETAAADTKHAARTPKGAGKLGGSGKGSRKVNKTWLHDHINDPYVKLATQKGYRSRAAYKLIGVDDTDHLIRPGMRIVDLGSAPGSWSQVAVERLGRKDNILRGRVVAIDLLPMDPIADVDFLQGDFREQQVADALHDLIGPEPLDLVLSDMAPNLSGVGVADAARMQDLAELAMDFAVEHLRPNGALLMKCFHGSGYSQIVEAARRRFVSVAPRKPGASRGRSAETFLLARGLRQSA